MDKRYWILIVFAAVVIVVVLPLIFISINERKRIERNTSRKETEPFIFNKGERGEYLVDRMLKEICDYFGGYCYQGLALEDEYGNWSEIDNVYIGPIGVYLIETKNRDGVIEIVDGKWIQRSGAYIHEVDNPIFQCQRHEKFFRRVIKNVGSIYTLTIFVSGDISLANCKDVYTLKEAEKFFMSRKRILPNSKVEYINSQVLRFVNDPPFTHEQYASWMNNQKRNGNVY